MRLQKLLPGLSQGGVLNLQPVSDPREAALQDTLTQVLPPLHIDSDEELFDDGCASWAACACCCSGSCMALSRRVQEMPCCGVTCVRRDACCAIQAGGK